MISRGVTLFAMSAVLWFGASCGPTTTACSASSCPSGCCDANGMCQAGDSAFACGSAGQLCSVCSSNATCTFGACVSRGGSQNGGGSQSGGGSAVGGGSDVGGGSGTGGGSAFTGGGSAVTGGGSAVTGGGSAVTGGGSASTGGGSAATGGGTGVVSGVSIMCSGTPASCQANINGYTVSGAVTVNNALPVLKSTCSNYTYEIGRLTFTNNTSHTSTSVTLTCANAGSYSLQLVAGAYEVRFSNGGGANAPSPDVILNSNFTVGGNLTGANFNINGYTVSGAVTINSALPVLKSNCSTYTYEIGRLTFTNSTSLAATSVTLTCANAGSYSVQLVSGVYEVRFSNGGGANAPNPEVILNANFTVGGNLTGANFNINGFTVSGAVTVNNALPVQKSNCSTYTYEIGRLTFTNNTSHTSTSVTLTCANAGSYSIQLVSGVYEVRFINGGGANAPNPEAILNANFTVSGNLTGANFNINGYTVSGAVTVNSALPVLKSNCSTYTYEIGRLTFTNNTSHTSTSVTLTCANVGSYSIQLVSGVYEVRFINGGGANAPNPEVILNSNFNVGGNLTGANFNINGFTVSGAVTVNSALPVRKSNCSTYTYEIGRLTFTNNTSHTSTSVTLTCANAGSYSLQLVSGVYEVRFINGGGANAPNPEVVLNSNFNVGGNLTGANFNIIGRTVSGVLTVNNAPPVLKSNCSSYTYEIGRLIFTNASSQTSASVTLTCVNAGAFSIELVSGTYEVRFSNGGGANAPNPEVVLNAALSL